MNKILLFILIFAGISGFIILYTFSIYYAIKTFIYGEPKKEKITKFGLELESRMNEV